MSADKALETALARIAALETRLSAQPAPAPAAAPQSQGIDPQAFARAFAANPVGVMQQFNIPVDHVSRVLVAHTLGDSAPPELRMLAQQGPLVSATQALNADLQAMRQRLEVFEQRDQQATRRQGFNALTADKAKYPRLAAVMARSPELFISEVDTYQGDTAALAADLERRLEATAQALGATPPASQANAEQANAGQSQQAKQAPQGVQGFDPTPPPIPPQTTTGPWTPEMDRQMKERIIRKYSGDAEPRE